jgi:hypothetical protein
MGCLDIKDKIAMMIDSLQAAKQMLSADSIRPDLKANLEEHVRILKADLRDMYIELFKIQKN